jgi:hypothetical protein
VQNRPGAGAHGALSFSSDPPVALSLGHDGLRSTAAVRGQGAPDIHLALRELALRVYSERGATYPATGPLINPNFSTMMPVNPVVVPYLKLWPQANGPSFGQVLRSPIRGERPSN